MPEVTVHLERHTAVTPLPRVLAVAGMFGLGLDAARSQIILPPTTLPLSPGSLLFITGPSGSGKSSLLSQLAQVLAAGQAPPIGAGPGPGPGSPAHVKLLSFDHLPALPDLPLVEAFGELSLPDTLSLLAQAGLGDAFVMLRRPGELSDGQRYRLRLAQMMALAQTLAPAGSSADAWTIVLADEFGATLDRLTAAVIARNLRQWVTRHGRVCAVVATTHDDLLEPLDPDVLVEVRLGGEVEVLVREAGNRREPA